jgi:hypothetical protein
MHCIWFVPRDHDLPPMTLAPSNEQLMLETLRALGQGKRADLILGEALRNAGFVDVPVDAKALHAFAIGPLRRAAVDVVDEAVATALLEALRSRFGWRNTAVGMKAMDSSQPSSSTPPQRISVPVAAPRSTSLRPRVVTTKSFVASGQGTRVFDVAIVDAEPERGESLANALRAGGLIAVHLADVDEMLALCESVMPPLVLVPHAALDSDGFSALDAARGHPEARELRFCPYAEARDLPDVDGVAAKLLVYASLDDFVARVAALVGGDAADHDAEPRAGPA